MSINKNKLRPIIIGDGFPASNPHPQNYPKDRLIKFLNLNIKDEELVWMYCRDYIFLPRDIRSISDEDGWLKGFQKEHKEILSISIRATNNLLAERDFKKINRILKNIHPELTLRAGKDYSKMNLDLDGIELNQDRKDKKYPSFENHHYGSIVSIWQDLVKHIINIQDVRQCLYCGQFFEVAPRSHGQKFCTGTNCQNSYNHKKRYTKKSEKAKT